MFIMFGDRGWLLILQKTFAEDKRVRDINVDDHAVLERSAQ
jgi:hypothetical protein